MVKKPRQAPQDLPFLKNGRFATATDTFDILVGLAIHLHFQNGENTKALRPNSLNLRFLATTKTSIRCQLKGLLQQEAILKKSNLLTNLTNEFTLPVKKRKNKRELKKKTKSSRCCGQREPQTSCCKYLKLSTSFMYFFDVTDNADHKSPCPHQTSVQTSKACKQLKFHYY